MVVDPPAACLIGAHRWDEFADGRLHRLKRGKHFHGDLRAIIKVAGEAAQTMGKAVRCMRDEFGKYQYVWVEFADYQIQIGAPCPGCQATNLLRTHEFFGHCEGCGARLIFSGELPETEQPETTDAASSRPPSRDLGLYHDVRLRYYDSLPDVERWIGYGRRASGKRFLLFVKYPFGEDGSRMEDPEYPGEFLHKVGAFPLEPFADALDLDTLVPQDDLGSPSNPPGDA